MKSSKKFLALLLALMLCVGVLAGCGNTSTPAESSAPAESAAPAEPASDNSDTPLVVGYSPFSSKFSPFFAETAYDQDVASMTAISLLTSDRTGAIIYNGIEGETINYNGTDYTYYGPADLVVTENADGTVYYDFRTITFFSRHKECINIRHKACSCITSICCIVLDLFIFNTNMI